MSSTVASMLTMLPLRRPRDSATPKPMISTSSLSPSVLIWAIRVQIFLVPMSMPTR
jgi:hypothetical protein